MSDYKDIYRIGQVWTDIRTGDIKCEAHLKDAIIQTLLNYASEKHGTGHRWAKEHPVGILQEIADDLLKTAHEMQTHNGEVMTAAESDYYLELRVRFILIRKAVKNTIKNQSDGET